jgi:hypothetical protein
VRFRNVPERKAVNLLRKVPGNMRVTFLERLIFNAHRTRHQKTHRLMAMLHHRQTFQQNRFRSGGMAAFSRQG